MNPYSESIELSAEWLRKALPLMSRQAAALHPVSYAVWYGYVAQRDPALRAAVDDALAREGRLDEATTLALYQRFVAGFDADAAQRVADGMQHLLAGMADSAQTAGDRTASYGDALERLSQALSTESDRAGDAVSAVMADTRQMREAMQSLQERLAANQREINQLRDEVHRARRDAVVDPLTGLANRRGFDEAMAQCLAIGIDSAAGVWLLALDIDHFKQVNDTWGHGFGDQVLRAVAQLIKTLVPPESTVARTGGEEFAVLLPASDRHQALALAEQVRQRVSAARIKRHDSGETLARVTLSVGLTSRQPGEAVQAFVERADRALYASKQAGRDRVTELPGA
ncbi:MAG: diguanylate cyclase [Burkholderiales bacterium]|nr:diguanylate cyclase [Burkholderiales bacterium]